MAAIYIGVGKEQSRWILLESAVVQMATSIPARIVHIDEKVGTIQPGLFADLFLLHGDASQPFDSMLQSKPQDVSSVMVNGVPIYGDATLMSKFNVTTEPVSLCGETKSLNLNVCITENYQVCNSGSKRKWKFTS